MRKQFFLFTLLLCLCTNAAWGSTTLTVDFTSSNSAPAFSFTASDGVVFTFSNSYMTAETTGLISKKGQYKLSKSMTTNLTWSNIASGGSITITSFSVTAASGGNHTWFAYTNRSGKIDDSSHSAKGTSDNTVTLTSSLLSPLGLSDYIVIQASGNSDLYIKGFSITYTVSPATFYFQANATGNKSGNYFVSFDNEPSETTTATTSVVGETVQANSAEATAYFTAVPVTADGWSFEGWYEVDANGDPTETQYSDQASCSKTFESSSFNSLSPEELTLYAKYTEKSVPTFAFNLKVGIAGQPAYTDVFTTSNSDLALTSVTNSNDAVATVEYNLSTRVINVTALSKGQTTVTITQPGNEDWVAKTQSYTITVVNQGEWIWQTDDVTSGNNYYVYSTVSGFLNDADGFDTNPTVLWNVGGKFNSEFSLTATSGKTLAIYDKDWKWNVKTSSTYSDGNITLDSNYSDGYYSLFRKGGAHATFGYGSYFVGSNNGSLEMRSSDSFEWQFISPAQKAAYDSYQEASDLVGTYTSLYPSLEAELSSVLADNNYESTNWNTCKANLDAIIAKCAAFDVDYAKFNEITHKLTINATGDGFATFYSACPVSMPDGVTAYKGSYSAGILTLTEIDRENYIPACTPVILYNEGISSTIELTYYNGEVEVVTGNKLHGSTYNTPLTSSSVTIDDITGTAYALGYRDIDGDGNAEAGFFKYASTATQISANKAFLVLEEGASLAAIRIIADENNATRFSTIKSTENVEKFWQNGQIYIRRGSNTYDILGRKVQ